MLSERRNTLSKSQRLYKKTDIDRLFSEGKKVTVYPFRVIFLKVCDYEERLAGETSVLVSVSKKRFHRAYKRNRLKRLAREAWRLNKFSLEGLCAERHFNLHVALIYTATVILPYNQVLNAIETLVKRLQKELQ